MPKIYSTSRVAPGARLRYWTDLHSELLAPLEIKARDRGKFTATASVDDLGPLRVVKTALAPACVEHRALHVAQTRERRFRVLLPARGRLALRHAGHDVVLEAEDFALLDDAMPHRIEFDEPNESLWVAIAPAIIRAYLPAPGRLCGIRMPAYRPLNKVVGSMLLGLWTELEQQDLLPEQRPALARSLLQVMAAAFAVDCGGGIERSRSAAARCVQIKQYIETHLRSPDLTPTTVAAAVGLSRRYLRLLFAAENDCVTAYIRRRRLDECAFELAQPQWRGRSVTATAADWGFRSVAHFARAFKAAYGTTPSAFKQAHCETLHSVRRDEKRSAHPSEVFATQ